MPSWPTANSSVAVFEADAWSPGLTGEQFDQIQALELVHKLAEDKVARNAQYVDSLVTGNERRSLTIFVDSFPRMEGMSMYH